ncbi:MAG: OmpA family protein [Deltaproteobacteria bacterium]|nr:OmpA family protein [Deltaproteobacteria bacterium]
MKTKQLLMIVTVAVLIAGCATVTPKELVDARSAYRIASSGPAAQLAPAELYKAKEALNVAEQSYLKEPDSTKTKDLAYVAQRKSELAGAVGAIAVDQSRKENAEAAFQREQTEIVRQGKQDVIDAEQRTAEARAEIEKQAALKAAKEKSDAEYQWKQAEIARQNKQDLRDSEQRTAEARAQLERQQAETADKAKQDLIDSERRNAEAAEKAKQDLMDSERRNAEARAELARIAAVREDERGLVVTLSGGVLFRSAESILMPAAQVKLDQVAKALLGVRERNIIVEGHTDSQGSDSYNQGLSQRRADTVHDYLVYRGYPGGRIQSRGMGEGSPIANNMSPEGRANNRRVEIIIERQMQTSNR